MIEIKGACIAIEKERDKEGIVYELLSRYEESGSCLGDKLVTDDEIYEVKNPYWLSDTFIFSKRHFELFIYGKKNTICFIKVNRDDAIEEVGFDFASRFHFKDYKALLSRKDVFKATPIHRILFHMIGDELWAHLYSKSTKTASESIEKGCIYNRTLEERQIYCKLCSAACASRIKEK